MVITAASEPDSGSTEGARASDAGDPANRTDGASGALAARRRRGLGRYNELPDRTVRIGSGGPSARCDQPFVAIARPARALPAVSHGAARTHRPQRRRGEFRLDPQNQGEASRWHRAAAAFDRTIVVPGAWQAQGVGEPRGYLRHDYAGPAWYRRTVAVPAAWRGKSVTLAHRRRASRDDAVRERAEASASTAASARRSTFDVTDAVRPGADNVIALRIANPGAVPLEGPREQKPVRPTGMLNYIGNWGGIYGNVELLRHRADVDRAASTCGRTSSARVGHVRRHACRTATTRDVRGRGAVTVAPRRGRARARVQVPAGGRADVEVARADSRRAPVVARAAAPLHRRRSRCGRAGGSGDRVDERFGMRQLTTRGNVLLLNGKPLYLRGYGDDNIEVLTGFPPSSRDGLPCSG